MTLGDYIDAVRGAFRRLAEGGLSVPKVVHMAATGGAFHVKSAAFTGEPFYVAVKVNGNFPDNAARHGLPTIQGAIVLCDARNGSLLAVMDSSEVTAMRTGAATAVAAQYLCNDGIEVATIIGCGIQGRVQLLALLEVLPLQTVFVFDIDRDHREKFAREMSSKSGVQVIAADSISDATRGSHAIVTCTSSRAAFLNTQHIAPGTFVAAVGADNHDKSELHPELMKHARVITDLLEQCAEIGDLHHALAAGVMSRADVCADLAAVVAGTAVGRTSAEDIIVFDSTGLAIQDLAAAGMIYERASATGLGLKVDLT
jgi:ornithine cyclodeaminase/alanine dehydrogenase